MAASDAPDDRLDSRPPDSVPPRRSPTHPLRMRRPVEDTAHDALSDLPFAVPKSRPHPMRDVRPTQPPPPPEPARTGKPSPHRDASSQTQDTAPSSAGTGSAAPQLRGQPRLPRMVATPKQDTSMASFYAMVAVFMVVLPTDVVCRLVPPLLDHLPHNALPLLSGAALAASGWSLVLSVALSLPSLPRVRRLTLAYIFCLWAFMSLCFLCSPPPKQPLSVMNSFIIVSCIQTWAPALPGRTKLRLLCALPVLHLAVLSTVYAVRRLHVPPLAQTPVFYALPAALQSRFAPPGASGAPSMNASDLATHLIVWAIGHSLVIAEHVLRVHSSAAGSHAPRLSAAYARLRAILRRAALPRAFGTATRAAYAASALYSAGSLCHAVMQWRNNEAASVARVHAHAIVVAAVAFLEIVRADTLSVWLDAMRGVAERCADAMAATDGVELKRVLAAGASGTVYVATWKDSTVAAKLIRLPEHLTATAAQRLRNEALLTTRLRHPAITANHAAFIAPDRGPQDRPGSVIMPCKHTAPQTARYLVLVTELCPLGSLAANLALLREPDGRPRLVQCVETLCDIAAALEHLHSHQVTHGDLNPSNVLLVHAHGGRAPYSAKLCDFGMAQVLSGRVEQVSSEEVGTVAYCSPERIESGVVHLNSDVWSFGVLMWELFACRKPFGEYSVMQLLALDRSQIGELLPTPPDMPIALAYILSLCLQPDPATRLPATELREFLEQVRAHLSVLPRARSNTGSRSDTGVDAPSLQGVLDWVPTPRVPFGR